MIQLIEPIETTTLDDYSAHSHLAAAVQDLRDEAANVRRHIGERSILMINSTAQGGGVAEMLPKLVCMLQELGIETRWAVMGSDDPAFFRLTKRLHNMIHGDGNGYSLCTDDRNLFDRTGEANLEAFRKILLPNDLLVIHDPQPLAMGAMAKKQFSLPAVWRCHIGLDVQHPSAQAAWQFLEPYARVFDQNVFSAGEYIPDYLRECSSVIYPALDPLSFKNRYFRAERLMSILVNAGLAKPAEPMLTRPFPEKPQRLQPDGAFGPADMPDEIGFFYRPTITQISRWDRLKGFRPLLEGFVRLKKSINESRMDPNSQLYRRIGVLRLVMVGPDPLSIQDDPEGCEVLNELCASFRRLAPEIQKDVVLLTLPMNSRRDNAFMVNALQTASSIVIQNSIREGFGLTLTEAMWKGTPVIGTSAFGLRQQLHDRIHGRIVYCPENPEEIAQVLEEMLGADAELNLWSRNAQARVHKDFLIFNQVKKWLQILKSFELHSPQIYCTTDRTEPAAARLSRPAFRFQSPLQT
jgi:trehalose synthase